MTNYPQRMYWDPHQVQNPDFLPQLCKEVSSVVAHSTDVQLGGLFAAIKGTDRNGHAYIGDALARGAKVLLVEKDADVSSVPHDIRVLMSTDPSFSLAIICGHFFRPVPEHCLMVTGTDGKSSTSEFCRQMLHACGYPSASLGTLGVIRHDKNQDRIVRTPTNLTTMDAVGLGSCLRSLAEQGIRTVAMEASSHGLSQRRVDGISPHGAALTHIAHDHLDFHGTWSEYAESKKRLFTLLPKDGWVVLPLHDSVGRSLVNPCRSRGNNIFGFSTNADIATDEHYAAHMECRHIEEYPDGTNFTFRFDNGHQINFSVRLPIWGKFQAVNLMAAFGLAFSVVGDPRLLSQAMQSCRPVVGRMQRIGYHDQGGSIFVDYAHTPGALRHALQALQARSKGALWVVFGCGGDRDRQKRAMMGKVATDLARHVIITDDNPRHEDPDVIRLNIRQGAPHAREIGDRKAAIAWAIKHMDPQDTLVVAGKGHEVGQTIGNQVIPFDDTQITSQLASQTGWQTESSS